VGVRFQFKRNGVRGFVIGARLAVSTFPAPPQFVLRLQNLPAVELGAQICRATLLADTQTPSGGGGGTHATPPELHTQVLQNCIPPLEKRTRCQMKYHFHFQDERQRVAKSALNLYYTSGVPSPLVSTRGPQATEHAAPAAILYATDIHSRLSLPCKALPPPVGKTLPVQSPHPPCLVLARLTHSDLQQAQEAQQDLLENVLLPLHRQTHLCHRRLRALPGRREGEDPACWKPRPTRSLVQSKDWQRPTKEDG
jgi:hypothetical protein